MPRCLQNARWLNPLAATSAINSRQYNRRARAAASRPVSMLMHPVCRQNGDWARWIHRTGTRFRNLHVLQSSREAA